MTFLLLSLATFAVTNLLVAESGPFGVFTKLRSYVGVKQNVNATSENIERWMILNEATSVDEVADRIGTNVLSDILNCSHCCSVWVAAFFGLFLVHEYGWLFYPVIVLALHASSLVVKSLVYGTK